MTSINLFANMISIVKISSLLKLEYTVVPNNRFINAFSFSLWNLGYFKGLYFLDFKVFGIHLKYKTGKISNIRQIYMVSKPSSRIYLKLKHLKGNYFNNYWNTFTFLFFSTSTAPDRSLRIWCVPGARCRPRATFHPNSAWQKDRNTDWWVNLQEQAPQTRFFRF